MAQGELQGAISNLQTVCRVAAPLLWSNLYAWGLARGQGWGRRLGFMCCVAKS